MAGRGIVGMLELTSIQTVAIAASTAQPLARPLDWMDSVVLRLLYFQRLDFHPGYMFGERTHHSRKEISSSPPSCVCLR